MHTPVPIPLAALQTEQFGRPDGAFLVFASPEARCLGIATRFSNYAANAIYILTIGDEVNPQREANIKELRRLCKPVGEIVECPVRHSDPIFGIGELVRSLLASSPSGSSITVDLSTFPKDALLLTLRAVERARPECRLRLVYTEPGNYDEDLIHPITYGLRRVGVVPTFSAPYRSQEELVLVIFLGFETDRVLGLWQTIEPHRTIAIIGHPAYNPCWEGVSERLNAALLAGLEPGDIHKVDPRNPLQAFTLLKQLVQSEGECPRSNFYIAPLGTKPEALGVYYFCRYAPSAATVIYASPLSYSHQYISTGVGPSWVLPSPGPLL